ncbi:hypothetical protein EGQ50_02725 [Coxiella endosymbiont of Amblyomma sculptum]|uniref:CBU_0585 family protein n=1 Tax=Coxiella endosymbiont of Amblyomma sculptum TaxID=2487929 RepID=UPI00132EAC3C|nr:CBU_0585 family protein [Coxiella endosymbiont of Amblyomma sculptum]QHG92615.1 hypothetical protein EGQ50_02725 [Coxiella endosymbiont of Amblyomma sculptum]
MNRKGGYRKISETYVSKIDKEFLDFDKSHTRSPTQLFEIKKHEPIFYLRDNFHPVTRKKSLWDFE